MRCRRRSMLGLRRWHSRARSPHRMLAIRLSAGAAGTDRSSAPEAGATVASTAERSGAASGAATTAATAATAAGMMGQVAGTGTWAGMAMAGAVAPQAAVPGDDNGSGGAPAGATRRRGRRKPSPRAIGQGPPNGPASVVGWRARPAREAPRRIGWTARGACRGRRDARRPGARGRRATLRPCYAAVEFRPASGR